MKKSELAKAIRNVLAENTKNKLDESKIRQAIREVLAEEDPSGRTKLPAVSFLSRYHPEVFSTIADANIGVTNYDIADIIDDYVEYLKLFGADGKVINEEVEFKEGDKCLALLRGSAADGYEECTILGMDPSGVAVVQNKDGLSDEVYTKELRPIGGERNVNEEEYDIVRDIHSTLGRNASQDEVEDYLGRSLSGSELKALGFNSGKVTGYKYGQPQYAGQGQKKTYGRRY